MVQTYIDVLPLSQTATAAVTAKRFIGYGGAHAAAAAATMGVARTGAAIGEDFTADLLGIALATAGGVIAAGGEIEVGADGKGVAKAAGVTVARALDAAAADGDVIRVVLIPN